MSKKVYNIVDLFCGCGGLSFGFEWTRKYQCVLGIDNSSKAIATFVTNHSAKGICKDICVSEINNILNGQEIDIIVGGPPCQGLSLSGPRKYDDPRNKLFLSFVELAKKIRPKAFVLENVPGLISLYKGKVKEDIIREFTKLGYKVVCQRLNAANYGVPQLRRRVFFVGLLNGKTFEFPKPTHTEIDNGVLKSYITCEQAVSDLPSLTTAMGSEIQAYATLPKNGYQKLMRINSNFLHNHIGTKHTDKVKKIITLVPEGGNYKDLPEKYRKTRNFNVAWTRYR